MSEQPRPITKVAEEPDEAKPRGRNSYARVSGLIAAFIALLFPVDLQLRSPGGPAPVVWRLTVTGLRLSGATVGLALATLALFRARERHLERDTAVAALAINLMNLASWFVAWALVPF